MNAGAHCISCSSRAELAERAGRVRCHGDPMQWLPRWAPAPAHAGALTMDKRDGNFSRIPRLGGPQAHLAYINLIVALYQSLHPLLRLQFEPAFYTGPGASLVESSHGLLLLKLPVRRLAGPISIFPHLEEAFGFILEPWRRSQRPKRCTRSVSPAARPRSGRMPRRRKRVPSRPMR